MKTNNKEKKQLLSRLAEHSNEKWAIQYFNSFLRHITRMRAIRLLHVLKRNNDYVAIDKIINGLDFYEWESIYRYFSSTQTRFKNV